MNLPLKYYFLFLICISRLIIQAKEHPSIEEWVINKDLKSSLKQTQEIIKANRYSSPEIKDSILKEMHSVVGKNKEKLSLLYFTQSRFKDAESRYNQAIIALDSALYYTKSPYLYCKYLTTKSFTLILNNNREEAFPLLKQAESIANSLSDPELICEIILAHVELDRSLGRHKEAIKKLDYAWEIMGSENCEDLLCIRILDRYASIQVSLSGPEESKKYSFKALKLASEIGEEHSMAVSHNELGYIYEHSINGYDSAEYHYLKAIEIWSRLNTPIYTSNALSNIGRLYKKMEDPYKALKHLHEAHELIKNTQWFDTRFEVSANLAMIYISLDDSINYYKYLSEHWLAGSAILSRSVEDDIVGYERQFEQSENLRIIENQQSEIELKNAENKLKERKANQFLFFMILAIITLIGVTLWLRQTVKNRKEIAKINKELEIALEVKNGLLKEIHHRVKNNLQMISGLLTIQAKNTVDEVAKQALLESKARLKSMSLVHKRLYIGEGYNQVEITTFLRDIIGSFVNSDQRSQDIFELDIDRFFVHIEQAVPLGFVLHELISNSEKHAWNSSNKKVKLEMKLTADNMLNVKYSDNGTQKIDLEAKESASSLGIKLIKLFVVGQLKGEFDMDGSHGAVFKFSFKLRQN